MHHLKKYSYLDFNKSIDSYDNIEKALLVDELIYNHKFDVILAINCINFSLNNIDTFLRNFDCVQVLFFLLFSNEVLIDPSDSPIVDLTLPYVRVSNSLIDNV